MAGNIKGITVEIGGDTSKLGKALETSEKQSKNLQKELKQVNTALKFNPSNLELLTQKQKLLTQQIQATKEKLDTLKQAEAQVEAQFNAGEIGEEQFRAFQREIIETESKLKTYQSQLDATSKKASALDELTTAISDQEKEVEELKKEWKNAVLTYGEGSDEANALAGEIDELSTELKENKDKMSALDKAADELDNSLEDVEESSKSANEGFTVMKGVLADLASQAIQKVVRGLTDVAKKTLETGMNFESSMSQNAALFGATGEELDKLSQTAQHYGETTQFSASEAADALGYMALAGWDANKASEELGGVLDLAASSGMGLAEASDMVTDYLSAFSNTTMTAAQFADKLAYAQANSNTTAVQLGEAYKNSAANLNAAGQDVETVTSLLAAMANQGLKGSEAGTALSAMMRDLTAKMKDGKVQIGETAVAVQDSNGNYRDLTDILKDVEKATDGMGSAEKAAALSTTFTADSIKGLNLIMNDGVDKAAEFEEGLRGADGSAADMAKTMNDNVAGSLKLLKSNIESKMIKVFESAKGSIKSSVGTMSDALDSIDWDKVGEAVGKMAQKIADFFTFLVNNAETVKNVLKAIGIAITTTFAVNKLSNFISSIKNIGGSLTDLVTKLKGANTETSLFSTVVGALKSPVGLAALAVGGLVTALAVAAKKTQEQIEKQYGLTDAQKETIKAAKELKKGYDEMDSARKEANAGIEAEYGYLGELKDEYNGLLDSNGKVKKGYEDRANFIITQLAQALGVEREEIQKNIDKNGEMGKSIDNIIQKKQAEATLAANESAYTKAIQERDNALQTYVKTQETVNKREIEYSKARSAANKVMQTYHKMLENGNSNADEYLSANMKILEGEEIAKKAYKDSKKALEDAETAYVGYTSTIENYEGLSAAVISGDAEKIKVALQGLQANFITAETGTKTSLEKQLKNFKSNYSAMKKAVESGMPGVTKAQVKAAKDLVTKAEKELKKLEPAAAKAGNKAGTAHADAVSKTSKANETAGKQVGDSTKKGMDTTSTTSSGKKKGDDHATGVRSTSEKNKTAGKTVGQNTKTGMASVDTKPTGQSSGQKFADGVSSKKGAASSAGKTLGNNAKSGAGSVSLNSAGSSAGSSYVRGVDSKDGSAKTAGKGLGNNAKSGASSVSADSAGSSFGQGFINGMGSKLRGVINKAKELARAAVNAVQNIIKQGSPSRVMYQSGGFFGQGFINGIVEKIPGVVKAAQDMARQAVEAVDGSALSEAISADMDFNGASFDRQLENTFNASSSTPDFSAILERLDAVEYAIRNSRSAIVLDTGALVGETLTQIDSGLANTYALKARGV